MKTSLQILFVSVLACHGAFGQMSASHFFPTSLPIPTTGTGAATGCASGQPNTTQFTVSVPETFKMTHVHCGIVLTHSYVGDLTLTLIHCGGVCVLYNRVPGSGNDLNGSYWFDDIAPLSFASAVSGPGPVIPPGTYSPLNPLSIFNGMSSAGDWTILICDQASGDVGQLSGLSLDLAGSQTSGGTISPAVNIPDGNNGCVAPLVRAINVASPGIVDSVKVMIEITHPWVRDLDISLAHDGVVVMLSGAHTIKAGVGVQGFYSFINPIGLIQSFDAAANATAVGADISPGQYLPDQPLAAFSGHSQSGVWLLTICDTASIATGSLSHASIEFSSSAYALSLSQPWGPQSLYLVNLGGSPGNHFVNLVTIVPGIFPNGWCNGLDINVSMIPYQVSLGAPFFGTLDVCGSGLSIVSGAIPSGLPVQLTSFELDQNGAVVASVPAFQYVTL